MYSKIRPQNISFVSRVAYVHVYTYFLARAYTIAIYTGYSTTFLTFGRLIRVHCYRIGFHGIPLGVHVGWCVRAGVRVSVLCRCV